MTIITHPKVNLAREKRYPTPISGIVVAVVGQAETVEQLLSPNLSKPLFKVYAAVQLLYYFLRGHFPHTLNEGQGIVKIKQP